MINPPKHLDEIDTIPSNSSNEINKPCIHKYVLIQTSYCGSEQTDLFYCERCLRYEKRERPRI